SVRTFACQASGVPENARAWNPWRIATRPRCFWVVSDSPATAEVEIPIVRYPNRHMVIILISK
ncbi:MAG: hypothetical protein ACK53L_03065, partial [Pirellulaceae bacterium]